MMRFSILLVLVGASFSVQGQSFDTIRVMTYNTLYYGENTSFCNNSNNPIAAKDLYFKRIVQYAKPDVLVVNEMGASVAYANRILSKVLNVDGENGYEACSIKNNSFSSIVNGMFYNSEKLGLVWQKSIKKASNNADLVRVIDLNKFFYRDPELEDNRDTVFLYVAAAHFKAGDSSSDEAEREIAAEAFMEHISAEYDPGYFLFCGDLNLYSENEDAFKELTGSGQGVYRFYDLADASGSWHNSSSFSEVHTQSTRLSNTNSGCFSGGGMDDRFDFILGSGQIYQDTGAVTYIGESYSTLGQDGNHFNQEITQGGNSSVPSAVLAALYEMSDHLPVTADFKIRLLEPLPDTIDTADTAASIAKLTRAQSKVWLQNGQIRIELYNDTMVEFIDLNGQVLFAQMFQKGFETIPINHLPSGVFFIRTSSQKGVSTERMVIVH